MQEMGCPPVGVDVFKFWSVTIIEGCKNMKLVATRNPNSFSVAAGTLQSFLSTMGDNSNRPDPLKLGSKSIDPIHGRPGASHIGEYEHVGIVRQ